MTVKTLVPDRRAALKKRHRTAIVDAADALIRERGSARFSVDELADRADVSRRTVFNHFSSLDDVVTTACARELAVVIDTFEAQVVATPLGDGTFGSLFDEARDHAQLVSIRVPRRNERASSLYTALGFRLVAMDDLDHYYEWNPETSPI